MTTSGARSLWTALAGTVFVGFIASLTACASLDTVTPVTVSDVKSVAGKWEGKIWRSSFQPDHVTLTIQENGSFDIVSAERAGFSSRGKGKIVISEGRLLMEGEGGGRGVGTVLKTPSGELFMNVEGVFPDNSALSAKLSRSR